MSQVTVSDAGTSVRDQATTPANHDDNTGVAAELNIINLDAPVAEVPSPPIFTSMALLTAPPLDHFLSRRVRVGTFVMASTDVVGAVQDIYPIQSFLLDAGISAKVRNYQYLRGSFEVTLIVATTPGAYGAYAVSALPLAFEAATTIPGRFGASSAGAQTTCIQNCLSLDYSAMLDCAVSNTVTLTLPFTHVYESALISSYTGWELQLTCLQPLASGMAAASTTSYITVYGRFVEGYELSVPTYQAGDVINPKPSRMLAAVSTAANSLSAIPMIAPVMSLVSRGASIASRVAMALGYTVETRPANLEYMTLRSFGNVANAEGVDHGMVGALSCVARVSNDPRIMGGSGVDEASFASLMTRKVLVAQIPYSTSSLTGMSLGYVPVSPFVCQCDYTKLLYVTCHPTVAGYVGLPFDYWRGTMRYHVYIPVSKFHRGRLQVYWTPNMPTGATIDPTSTTFSHIWDVTPGKWITFEVGYQSNRPFLLSMTSNGTKVTLGKANYPAMYNGYLAFNVVTPLEGVTSSAATTILVFASATADMEFAMPTQGVYYMTTEGGTGPGGLFRTAESNLKYQSGALGDETAIEEEFISLVPVPDKYPVTEVNYGESFSSVRAYMQKPCQYRFVSTTLSSPGSIQLSPLSGLPNSIAQGFSWARHYSRMFYAVATSERVKILEGSASTNVYAVGRQMPYMKAEGASSMGHLEPVSYLSSQHGIEVTVPYYAMPKFVYGCWETDPGITPINQELVPLTTITYDTNAGNSTTIATPVIFYSYGDDVRVAHFTGVPTVLIVSNQTDELPGGGIFGKLR